MSGGIPAVNSLASLEEVRTLPDVFSPVFNDVVGTRISSFLTNGECVKLSFMNRKINHVIGTYYFPSIIKKLDIKGHYLRLRALDKFILQERPKAVQASNDAKKLLQDLIAFQNTKIGAAVTYFTKVKNCVILKIIALFRWIFPCINRAFQVREAFVQQINAKNLIFQKYQAAIREQNAILAMLPSLTSQMDRVKLYSSIYCPVGIGRRIENLVQVVNNATFDIIFSNRVSKEIASIPFVAAVNTLFKTGCVPFCFVIHIHMSGSKAGELRRIIIQQEMTNKLNSMSGTSSMSDTLKGKEFEASVDLKVQTEKEEGSKPKKWLKTIEDDLRPCAYSPKVFNDFLRRLVEYSEKMKIAKKELSVISESLTVPPCTLIDCLGGIGNFLSLPHLDFMHPKASRSPESAAKEIARLTASLLNPNERKYQLMRGYYRNHSDESSNFLNHCIAIVEVLQIKDESGKMVETRDFISYFQALTDPTNPKFELFIKDLNTYLLSQKICLKDLQYLPQELVYEFLGYNKKPEQEQ